MLAKAAGAVTIITSSSDEKLAYVKQKYGADFTINYKKTPDWAAEVKKLVPRGADFVLDAGGSGTIQQSIGAVARGGQIALFGVLSPAAKEAMPDVATATWMQGCIIRGINVGSKQQLDEVVQFVGSKNLQLPVERTFGFSRQEVLAAYEYLGSDQHVGKVCIDVN